MDPPASIESARWWPRGPGHRRIPRSSELVPNETTVVPGRTAWPSAPGTLSEGTRAPGTLSGGAWPSAPGTPSEGARAPGPSPAVAFVINRTLVRDPERFARRCRAAAAARGWAPLFLPTTREDHGEGLARHAAAAGAELVFAVGGDGTVRACASALAGTGVRLAIIPRGTANLAAHALGIPHRLGAALSAGFGSHETALDLGVAEGAEFTTMAGIGLDAAVVDATRRERKLWFGWLAYAEAGLGHLHGTPNHFTVRLDGARVLHRRARSVVVGNAGLLPGGFPLLPDARPDDGLLDVGILAPTALTDWARIGYRVLTRSRRDDHCLERFRARRVEITADAELPRETDGEIIPPGRSLTVTVRPGALAIRTPAR
jgi:diacylglycerol kinase family enzyme